MHHFKISSDAAYYVFLCFAVSITIITITTTEAAEDLSLFPSPFCPNNASTFTPNGTYHSNLNQLLSWLSSNSSTSKIGYYNATIGANDPNNTIYGAFLCRGDLSPDNCRDCVSTAEKQVLQSCPVERSSMIWLTDKCYVRFSDQSFFSKLDQYPLIYRWGGSAGSDVNRFMDVLGSTLKAVANQAAEGGAGKYFGTKEGNISAFQTLYTAAQCMTDLSQIDCRNCLGYLIGQLPSRCNGSTTVIMRVPSCNIRYELFPFYDSVTASVSTPPPQEEQPRPNPSPSPKDNSRLSTVAIIGIVASIVLVLLVSFTAFWIIRTRARRKNKYSSKWDESSTGTRNHMCEMPLFSIQQVQISSVDMLQFDFDTVRRATNNFSYDKKLGEGGFGEVYKGTLPNGQDIAVKRLSKSSHQGANEFKNEVVLVAKLQHKNLVRLLGFCLDGKEKMLIYEFVPNKSLDHFLFDPNKQYQLNWPRRYMIIEGIARGMLYLHEDSRLKIIHRDLKASNILLDGNLNPKISDFGMARIFGADQTQGNTNKIVGTYGYISPEYAMHGHLSVKADVYSFGVLILEIIFGKKITSFHESNYGGSLLNYAWTHWRDETPLEILNMSLRGSYSRAEVIRCIHIGLSCVQEDPTQRPTMQSVVLMLNSHSVTLATPKQPARYFQRRIQKSFPAKEPENSDKSTSHSGSASVNEASITDLYPR